MAQWQKILDRILSGKADSNIGFTDACHLLSRMGFVERIEGDHHIFTKSGIQGLIDIQPRGSVCKDYQVKQIRKLLKSYQLITVV